MTTNAKCYLDPAHSNRHFLTLRKGQYWGHHVDLKCSYCGMTCTVLKSSVESYPYNGAIVLSKQRVR